VSTILELAAGAILLVVAVVLVMAFFQAAIVVAQEIGLAAAINAAILV